MFNMDWLEILKGVAVEALFCISFMLILLTINITLL